jgi:membrane-associated phospholipid phosphatase
MRLLEEELMVLGGNSSAKKSILTIFQNENDRNPDNIIFARIPMRGKYYFGLAVVLLMLSYLWILLSSSSFPTLWANRLHNHYLDVFFSNFTLLGEWPLISISIAVALYKQPKLGLWFGCCFLIELFIVQGLKFGLNEPRPIQELGKALFEAPGSPIAAWKSFPSGHTAGAFTALGLFAVNTQNRFVEILYVIIAALVGFSRLYLGQHYLHDVAAGICIALFIWLMFSIGKSRIRALSDLTW